MNREEKVIAAVRISDWSNKLIHLSEEELRSIAKEFYKPNNDLTHLGFVALYQVLMKGAIEEALGIEYKYRPLLDEAIKKVTERGEINSRYG